MLMTVCNHLKAVDYTYFSDKILIFVKIMKSFSYDENIILTNLHCILNTHSYQEERSSFLINKFCNLLKKIFVKFAVALDLKCCAKNWNIWFLEIKKKKLRIRRWHNSNQISSSLPWLLHENMKIKKLNVDLLLFLFCK